MRCRAESPAVVRGIVFSAVASAFLLGASSTALASAGCDAVNAGGFDDSVVYPPPLSVKTITGFAPGDRIEFKISTNASPGWLDSQWFLRPSAGGAILAQFNGPSGFPGATLGSYTVTGTGDTTLRSEYQAIYIQNFGLYSTGAANVSATCTPGISPNNNTNINSQKLRNVQIQGSTMAAQASGTAISGSVGGAIDAAFADGGNPVTIGPNGMTLNFAAEPRAARATQSPSARTEEAFSALAYAAGRNVAKAPPLSPVFERRWSAWLDVRGSGWDKSQTVDGNQINVTGGVGYKVAPNILIGVFGGYEDFRYNFDALSGRLKGDGGTVGGYAAWQIAPTLRWDAMLGWSGISYDATAGIAAGNFDGSRWLVSTGLAGSYRYAAYILEPSAKVYALWERQDAWTDSLGTLQADRSFSTGRVSLGGRVIAPSQYNAFSLAPYLGFYGDWRFSSDDALPVSVPNVGLVDGWSGRVTGGVSMSAPMGGTLSLGGEYGGIGAGYGVWTANARAHWPF